MLEKLVVVALIATFVVLLVGVGAMVRGGEFNRKHGNTLMRLRVAMQALAIALLFTLYLLNRG